MKKSEFNEVMMEGDYNNSRVGAKLHHFSSKNLVQSGYYNGLLDNNTTKSLENESIGVIIQNTEHPPGETKTYLKNESCGSDRSFSGEEEQPIHEQQHSPQSSLLDHTDNMNRLGEVLNRTRSYQSISASDDSCYSEGSSQNSLWGWFEDLNVFVDPRHCHTREARNRALLEDHGTNSVDITILPNYVLAEESMSSLHLWKESAGLRPIQPREERELYEKLWAENFERSQVKYQVPVEELTAASPASLNPFADGCCVAPDGTFVISDVGQQADESVLFRRMNKNVQHTHIGVNKTVKDHGGKGHLNVLAVGENVVGTTVSRSFQCQSSGTNTVNVGIASYRVVLNQKHEKYAQFLVIYREGSMQNTVGSWKRYKDFEELAKKVTLSQEGCVAALASISPLAVIQENESERLPNSIASWNLVQKRKRWFRCLDAGYLSLKVFLLERFLHDVLFESTSPQILHDFVCADSPLKQYFI